MKRKDPSLSLAEVAAGMIACRSNARELLEEAGILMSSSRPTRAYALLHTACEELAKFSILRLGGARLAHGNPPSWKRFWQRFRSHDSKAAQLNVQARCLFDQSGRIIGEEIVKSTELILDYGLAIRNAALYVDVGPDGRFRKPSDIDFTTPFPILRNSAQLALCAADCLGNSVADIELSLQKGPNQREKENSLSIFDEAIQRCKDAGMSRGSVTAILKKILTKE